MTDANLSAFGELFEDLWFSGLPRTPQRDQLERVKATYFEALRAYTWDAVRHAGAHLQHTAESWPPVQAWTQAIRKNPVAGLPMLSPSEIREWTQAEASGFEGPCCNCAECQRAGAAHLPTRYVPVLDGNGNVQPVQIPGRQRPAAVGMWLHGSRLKGWYAARAAFYERLASLQPKAMPKVHLSADAAQTRGEDPAV